MSNKNSVKFGLHYGERVFDPEKLIDNVEKYGKNCDLVMIRPRDSKISDKQYCEWARYFKEKQIYFCFLYTITIKDGEPVSTFPKGIAQKMHEIAGEYFIGDALGEIGNSYSNHVYDRHGEENVQFKTVQEAKDTYIQDVKSLVSASKKAGLQYIGIVESTTLQKYNLEAGVDECYPELLLVNPEYILSFARGASRGYERKRFGGYVAHEWYGGVRHDDALKAKRLGLIYKTAYIAGADKIFLESGYDHINSYGMKGDENHPYCQMVRNENEAFAEFIKKDVRPENGPEIKVAFVSGNLDGYTGNSTAYGGVISPLWGQRSREEWDRGASEYSWRILDEVYRSCDWHYPINYGDADYSSSPAYGLYDVIPAESTLSAMERYDWLIFAGWNTMTEEIYEKLKSYVKNGGNLLVSAAHMKVGDIRGQDSAYIHEGKLEDFLGCNLTDKKFRSNKGFKFERESIADGVLYPGAVDCAKDLIDPIGSDGYTTYVEIEEKTCRKAVFLARSFRSTVQDYETQATVLAENTYGKGNVLFMCTDEYPGASGVYTLYKLLVKSILAATHRNCDVKVLASDKVRFAVYKDDKKYKVYLLNTDMNLEQKVRIAYKEQTIEKTILPCELDYVEVYFIDG